MKTQEREIFHIDMLKRIGFSSNLQMLLVSLCASNLFPERQGKEGEEKKREKNETQKFISKWSHFLQTCCTTKKNYQWIPRAARHAK